MISVQIARLQTQIFLLAAVLVFSSAWRDEGPCLLADREDCPNITVVKRTRVWDFIPNWDYAVQCKVLREALSCALQPRFTETCVETEYVQLSSKKAFLDAICGTHQQAYRNSVYCVTQEPITSRSSECLADFKINLQHYACGPEAFSSARECLGAPLDESLFACTIEDIKFLKVMADVYLRSVSDAYGCSWESTFPKPEASTDGSSGRERSRTALTSVLLGTLVFIVLFLTLLT